MCFRYEFDCTAVKFKYIFANYKGIQESGLAGTLPG